MVYPERRTISGIRDMNRKEQKVYPSKTSSNDISVIITYLTKVNTCICEWKNCRSVKMTLGHMLSHIDGILTPKTEAFFFSK